MSKHRILVLLGGEYHDFEQCGRILQEFLDATGRFDCTRTRNRGALRSLSRDKYDAVLLFTQGGKLTQAQEDGLTGFVKAGGGFVGIHCASDSFTDNKAYMKMIGAQFTGHGPVVPFQVQVKNTAHPLAARVMPFTITDELYILRDHAKYDAYLEAYWHGQPHPMAYTRRYGKGRVAYLALGHGPEAFSHPAFQTQVIRQLRWACGETKPWKKTIGCAVIGYGGAFNMGKTHADAINRCAGLKVVALCDIDPVRAEVARNDFPEAEVYTDVGKLLADEDVELCVIVTPHNTHAELAIQCSQAGKHVVCEKPFCITIDEATAMIEAARQAGKICSVFHNRRRDGDFMAIKQVIESGAIGEVFHIDANAGGYGRPGDWWRSSKQISGGALYDWGAHFVDWILQLIPRRIESVYGFLTKKVWHHVTNEDHCWVMIRFENDAVATFEQSSLAAVPKPKWRILGTKGGIEANWGEQMKVIQFGPDGRRIESAVPYLQSDWDGYYRSLADHLLEGAPLEVTPESARRVIGVFDLAEKASKQNKPLPMPYEDEYFAAAQAK